MDEINDVIKRALSFVCTVQNHCDQQRLDFECHIKKELRSHVHDMKRKTAKNEEQPQSVPKEPNIEHIELNEEVKQPSPECEELKLADRLLRKARYVRQKYKFQVPFADERQEPQSEKNISSDDCSEAFHSSASSQKSCKVKQSQSVPTMHRGKALPSCTSGLNSKLPRAQKCSSESNIPVRTSKKCAATQYHEKGKDTDSVIVPKEVFHMYRNLKLTDSSEICSGNTESRCATIKIDQNSRNCMLLPSCGDSKSCTDTEEPSSDQTQKLHDENVLHVLEPDGPRDACRKLVKGPSEDPAENKELQVCFMKYLWYPFVNFKNGRRLTISVTYRNSEELKRAVVLFHKIQEAMFWLDFFSLVGKEINSVIQNMDQSDQKIALAFSYLQSLFQGRLQRVPVYVRKGSCKNKLKDV